MLWILKPVLDPENISNPSAPGIRLKVNPSSAWIRIKLNPSRARISRRLNLEKKLKETASQCPALSRRVLQRSKETPSLSQRLTETAYVPFI